VELLAPAICLGAVACAGWAVRGRSSTLLAPSVWRGPGDRKAVALTFDDGPCASTPHLLDLLAQLGVRATFFQIGRNAVAWPAVARQVSAAGHEIGNHTMDHPRLWLRSPGFIERQVAEAQRVLTEIHGSPPRLFRAPYGVRWPGLGSAQRRSNVLGVMWSTIGRDWSSRPDAVARRLTARVFPGAILCLHDGRELATRPDISDTIDAVRRAVPEMQAMGYQFETVSNLLCPMNSRNA